MFIGCWGVVVVGIGNRVVVSCCWRRCGLRWIFSFCLRRSWGRLLISYIFRCVSLSIVFWIFIFCCSLGNMKYSMKERTRRRVLLGSFCLTRVVLFLLGFKNFLLIEYLMFRSLMFIDRDLSFYSNCYLGKERNYLYILD